MFILLHNNTNQELVQKYVRNQSSHYEKLDGAVCPDIIWNWSIHCLYMSAMFNLLHNSTNQELFEKHLCN